MEKWRLLIAANPHLCWGLASVSVTYLLTDTADFVPLVFQNRGEATPCTPCSLCTPCPRQYLRTPSVFRASAVLTYPGTCYMLMGGLVAVFPWLSGQLQLLRGCGPLTRCLSSYLSCPRTHCNTLSSVTFIYSSNNYLLSSTYELLTSSSLPSTYVLMFVSGLEPHCQGGVPALPLLGLVTSGKLHNLSVL